MLENDLRKQPKLLGPLLIDRSRTIAGDVHYLIWATDSYAGHQPTEEIQVTDLVSKNQTLVCPRAQKPELIQKNRTQDFAEVFTPQEIVGVINSKVDNHSEFWPVNESNWQSYVHDLRLEIACGEAPFIANRYDMLSGVKVTDLSKRAGFLDRKLQVVSRYCQNQDSWRKWAVVAYKACYGYEWQGDNLLLARENLLYTFVEYWNEQFPSSHIDLGQKLAKEQLEMLQEIAEIISWNIFQMDGLRYTLPMSCVEKVCRGCRENNSQKHNGIYAKVMDWEQKRVKEFVELLEED